MFDNTKRHFLKQMQKYSHENLERLHSFVGTTCFLSVKSLTNFTIQKYASMIKPREIGEPPSATYTLVYNPPRRVAPWSIVSPIYVRWEVFSCIPFRFCSCLFAFVKDIFFCMQEHFHWN